MEMQLIQRRNDSISKSAAFLSIIKEVDTWTHTPGREGGRDAAEFGAVVTSEDQTHTNTADAGFNNPSPPHLWYAPQNNNNIQNNTTTLLSYPLAYSAPISS